MFFVFILLLFGTTTTKQNTLPFKGSPIICIWVNECSGLTWCIFYLSLFFCIRLCVCICLTFALICIGVTACNMAQHCGEWLFATSKNFKGCWLLDALNIMWKTSLLRTLIVRTQTVLAVSKLSALVSHYITSSVSNVNGPKNVTMHFLSVATEVPKWRGRSSSSIFSISVFKWPGTLQQKKFTVVRHPCRLTTLPSNTRVSLSWDLTLIPISLGRHPEETRAFLMSARSLEMLRDTSEVISSITMFSFEITSKREIVFLSWSLLAKSSRWKKIHSDEKSQEASIQFLMIVAKVTADICKRGKAIRVSVERESE